MFVYDYLNAKDVNDYHAFISGIYFADWVKLADCLAYGFIDMGGGYVAYRNPDSCLYIAGNLKSRKVFDVGQLNDAKYIRTDVANTVMDYSLDLIRGVILESPFSHLFEIRK